ncbi:MAG: SBBP repeat-containing protein [Chloroflexi bacterium]|nr:SBBP repeat-containing protein [Chloroflexota bacterium]
MKTRIQISATLLATLVCARVLRAQSPWTYSTYLGGVGSESGLKVAADRSGNTYVAGSTTSVGFPFTSDQPGWSSGQRTFLLKLDPSGRLVFAKTVEARLGAMAVDPEGNSYLAGAAAGGRGFETTPGSFQATVNGGGAFVMKVDSEGRTVFSTYFGNMGSPQATTVAFDAERNVIACGAGRARDLPLTEDAIQSQSERPNEQAGFCAVLSADGAELRFSTLFGGSGPTVPSATLVDESGDLVLIGSTASADFPLKGPIQSEDPRRMLFRFDPVDQTWSPVGGSSIGGVVSINFGETADRIYLGTGAGAQVSEDGGGTWRRLPSLAGTVVAHPRNSKYLCTVTSSLQLYCSSNGGQQWQPAILNGVRQAVADPKIEGGFYVATSSELRYVSLAGARAPHVSFGPVESIAIEARGENTTIWAISANSLHRSQDGGARFERIGDNFSRIFASPQSPGVLYGTRASRPTAEHPWLVRSTDGGSSWTDVVTGFEPRVLRDLAIDPRSPTTLFIAGDGVYRSQDAGESWTLISAGLTNGSVRALQFDPEGNLWAGADALQNGFAAKLDLKDRAIEFSMLLTGSGGSSPVSAQQDSSGRILVLGRTFSTDLPVSAEPIQAPSNPYGQDFLAVLEANGRLAELRLIGLDSSAMALDALGRLHLAGSSRVNRETAGGVPIGGSFLGGGSEGVWTVLDLETGSVVQATWLGGSGADEISGIAIGPDGMVRLAGMTSSDDFPTADPFQAKRAGLADGFLSVAPLP